jgi:hypothetical protein
VIIAFLLSTGGGLAGCLWLSGSRNVLLSEGSPRQQALSLRSDQELIRKKKMGMSIGVVYYGSSVPVYKLLYECIEVVRSPFLA